MKKIFSFLIFAFVALQLFSQTAEEYYLEANKLDTATKDGAKEAITLLTKALDEKPLYTDALLFRFKLYQSQEMYKEEIADITSLIKIDSTSAGYYKMRANAYSLKKDPENAIADYTKAYSIDTSMIECIYERGNVYVEFFIDKKAKLAIDDFTYCIAHSSISIKALSYVGRGRVYAEQEDYDKSISDYNTALKVNPFCKEAFLYRGILKISANENGCYDLLTYRQMYGYKAQKYLDKYCPK